MFLAKSHFWIFLQEIKSGKKYYVSFHVNESEHRRDTRECSRPKRAWPTRPDSLAAWVLLVRPSSAASSPTFLYAFIYIEKGVTYEIKAIRET
jgi:hypothetical protein